VGKVDGSGFGDAARPSSPTFQPTPERLGFYDLRLPEVRAAVGAGRAHGIHGSATTITVGTKPARTTADRDAHERRARSPFLPLLAKENDTRGRGERELLIEQRYGPSLTEP